MSGEKEHYPIIDLETFLLSILNIFIVVIETLLFLFFISCNFIEFRFHHYRSLSTSITSYAGQSDSCGSA